VSRRLVVAGALIGVWAGVKAEPGYGTEKERDATLDALLVPRRKAAREQIAAIRQAGYRAWDIHHGQRGEAS
jgi:hypothetical protein